MQFVRKNGSTVLEALKAIAIFLGGGEVESVEKCSSLSWPRVSCTAKLVREHACRMEKRPTFGRAACDTESSEDRNGDAGGRGHLDAGAVGSSLKAKEHPPTHGNKRGEKKVKTLDCCGSNTNIPPGLVDVVVLINSHNQVRVVTGSSGILDWTNTPKQGN